MPPEFALLSLVTDHAEHAAMRESFARGGFCETTTETLIIDNTRGNQADAYRGYARLIALARAPLLILAHQDLRLLRDDAATLRARLADLDARDPAWALAGNAGGLADGSLAIRITDPHGADQRVGALPARAASLDENFIVLRRVAGIGFSAPLSGFHLYGADLCLDACAKGRSAWVIDFHLQHLSGGRVDAAFLAAEAAFEAHWSGRIPGLDRLRTTCTTLDLRPGWLPRLGAGWRRARRRRRL
jgi:hypothetical protein